MAITGGKESRQIDELSRRPRRSLARRTMFWMAIIAVLPTIFSAIAFHQLFNRYVSESHGGDIDTLATLIARSVSGRLDHQRWSRQQGEVLDGLSREPRIAFVCVLDRAGKPLHLGVFDQDVWDSYVDRHGPTFGRKDVTPGGEDSAPIEGNILIKTAYVRSIVPDADDSSTPGEIEGAVLLAMKEPAIRAVMWTFHSTQLGVALLVCLVALPIMALVMRGWIKPLRSLIEATRRLAMGKPPKPVSAGRDDEIGYLSRAFNDMAGQLLAQHRKLIDANENLEQRVKQRTVELQDAIGKLDVMANTDPLTGLANRRALHDQLESHFAASRISGGDLAVIMMDLDGFKPINDTYGHDKGDELLVAVAELIRETLPAGGIGARMGGDEFIVLYPRADAEAAVTLAEEIRLGFEDCGRRMFAHCDPPPTVSMSLGVSSYRQERPQTADTLIAQADGALYRAKGSGKSRVEVYVAPPAAA